MGKRRQKSGRNFDKLIVAVGRVPYTEGIKLGGVGLTMENGRIVVNELCRTNYANVYAIGDVVRGPMLAHKAEDEGAMVAELIVGQKPEIDYDTIPWVIYTHPEIAWVGKTEQELKKAGTEYNKGSFPFMANGRARGLGETEGMVKMLADAKMTACWACISWSRRFRLNRRRCFSHGNGCRSEDIARTCHAHPTLSEAFREAALAVDKRAIHI